MEKFYPIEEKFPEDILCPLCRHKKECDDIDTQCKTLLEMENDMEDIE